MSALSTVVAHRCPPLRYLPPPSELMPVQTCSMAAKLGSSSTTRSSPSMPKQHRAWYAPRPPWRHAQVDRWEKGKCVTGSRCQAPGRLCGFAGGIAALFNSAPGVSCNRYLQIACSAACSSAERGPEGDGEGWRAHDARQDVLQAGHVFRGRHPLRPQGTLHPLRSCARGRACTGAS